VRSPNLENAFPQLRGSAYSVESPKDRRYNCIAWAAGETHRWWWPAQFAYWPPGLPRTEDLDNFVKAFETIGYYPCDDSSLESGSEKVALFADVSGIPTHAARQQASGRWVSKLGREEDIEHATPFDLEGRIYGSVILVLKRPRDH
jgi:hypothetical protein